MKNEIHQIKVEKNGVSDSKYLITKLYLTNGSKVEIGDVLFSIESSKMVIDIESTNSGFIFYGVNEYDEVFPNQTIAIITNTNIFNHEWSIFFNSNQLIQEHPIKEHNGFSQKALLLIEKYNIEKSIFKNHETVTQTDVINYLNLQSKNYFNLKDNDIVIYGGGGHGKMCIDILKKSETYEIIGIIDKNIPLGSNILGIDVLGDELILNELISKGLKNAVLGIGNVKNHADRKSFYSFLLEHKLNIPNLFHKTASIESSAKFGNGNQIMQGAIIGSNVKIGNNCIINSGSIISHDTVIEDNVHIAPGAIIGGNVIVKNNTLIGMGVTIYLGVEIGSNVIINNGINIFKNIPDNEIVRY